MFKEKIHIQMDQTASQRERWMKKSSYYYRSIERFINLQVPAGASVLEVGCSTGSLLASLASSRGLGIDISNVRLAIAREKYPHLEFVQNDIEDLDLSDTFDYVVMSDVVGMLHDVQTAFENVSTVSRRETRFIVTYYNQLWEPLLKLGEKIGLKEPQEDQNWLSSGDLENLLDLSGFEVVRKGTFLLFPKNIPIISFLLNRFIAHLPIIRHLCLVQYLIARLKPEPLDATSLKTSVVIPVRNEEETIEIAVQRVPTLGKSTEIIFVEGHSEDDTLTECYRIKEAYPDKEIEVYQQPGKGKADAVRLGFDQANGDVLMILDGDLTVRPETLPKFFDAIVEGKGELVIGSRLVYPMEKQAMRFLNMLGNKFFSMLYTYLLDQRIRDTLCGTKVLLKEDYEKIVSNRSYFGDFDPFGDFDLLLAAFDIATLSSSHGEAFPNVVAEAMACETPCVVTDSGDAGVIVGDTGFLVPTKNPEALTGAWQQLLSLSVEERLNLGKAARLRIEKDYQLSSAIQHYEDLYLSLS